MGKRSEPCPRASFRLGTMAGNGWKWLVAVMACAALVQSGFGCDTSGGMDIPGCDIRGPSGDASYTGILVGNVEACCTICKRASECYHFSYDGYVCYLKDFCGTGSTLSDITEYRGGDWMAGTIP